MNEIQLASQTITGIVERMNSYEKEKERNAIRKFLQAASTQNRNELSENLTMFNIPGKNNPCFFIIVLRVGGYQSFVMNNTHEAIDFQLNSIETIASELLSGKGFCCKGVTFDDHVSLILTDAEGLKNFEMAQFMAEVQETVQRMLGLQVTVGISDLCSDVTGLPEKYREAYDLTNYRLVYGKHSIIDISMAGTGRKEDIPNEMLDAALEAVTGNSRQAFEEAVDKLISNCVERRISCNCIAEVFSGLAASMLRVPKESGISGKSTENFNPIDLLKHAAGLEDFSELKSWLFDIFERVAGTISEANHIGIRDIVSKALEYIAGNYSNPEVTASSMADKLSISSSYFSRIFKECVGTSFPDYIINLRLEKAREILIQADQPCEIKDVCFRVGYSNNSYFTAAFKKKYGITPSKYRLHCLAAGETMSNH
jgi:YesN/AraC family two-component response regulator